MPDRQATINRKTKETEISLTIDLDGEGKVEVATGIGFFDHMLDHLGRHGLFDVTVRAKGDLHVDGHHTVEDVAICLGQAIDQALGDKAGIFRYGHFAVPMEETLAEVTVDLSGRPVLVYRVAYPGEKVGAFDVELVEEFLRGMANNARMNLHVNVPYGTNNHHIAEAVFKALGKAMAMAVAVDPRRTGVPSTKGTL
jgi:imidazoleglycerol-phosphate dehydratase